MGISVHSYRSSGRLLEGRNPCSTNRSLGRHCDSHIYRCSGNRVSEEKEESSKVNQGIEEDAIRW